MRKTFLKTLVATAVVGATVALSSAFAFAGTVIDSWTANDLTTGTMTQSSLDLGKNFTFSPVVSSGTIKSKVNANSKIFTDGTEFTQRLQLGGRSTLSKNSGVFTFVAPSDGTLTIYAVTGTNDDPRTIELYDADGKDLKTWTSGPIEDATTYDYEPFTYTTIESGKTYQIASTGAAVNYYGMTFTSNDGEDEDPFKTVTNGAVYVTDSDTYVIAGVSKEDVTTANGVTVTIGKTGVDAGTTVYKNVVIGDETITNTQVGADYIVAIKVAGANKDARVESFTVTAK